MDTNLQLVRQHCLHLIWCKCFLLLCTIHGLVTYWVLLLDPVLTEEQMEAACLPPMYRDYCFVVVRASVDWGADGSSVSSTNVQRLLRSSFGGVWKVPTWTLPMGDRMQAWEARLAAVSNRWVSSWHMLSDELFRYHCQCHCHCQCLTDEWVVDRCWWLCHWHHAPCATNHQGWLRSSVVRTSVSDRWTFPGLRSICSGCVTTYVGITSAIGQPTMPTQPFILPGSINE